MNKDITLVILAAGMGSRFGGLKQMEPIGPTGQFIIDYSVYDAIKAGFNKVVFIIKEENYDAFKETIGSRVEPYIKVEYCFQKNDNIPEGYKLPEDRVKPLGTAHALYCAKDKVNENFAIISADDFFGYDAFKKAADFLKENNDFCVIGYKIGDTLSDKGAVKRGVCI
jgi:NDP-sugar pyrophosphorylase family protein